tara:strand:+ start:239 stop:1246 length:1008 start_codon:yes stop_codon:yes gene_type:complete
MNSKPTIYIIGTGGTIAGEGSNATTASYKSGQIDTKKLVNAIPSLGKKANIRTETLFSTGSENLGPENWKILALRIEELSDDPKINAFIVTHGTDTLEEAAFFLDLVLKPKKPIVLTGAMRSSTALSADGPANIFQASLAAISPKLKNQGVLIVMNSLIIQGRQAIKTDSLSLEAFSSYPGGSIGKIVGEEVFIFGIPRPSPIMGRFNSHLLNEKKLPFVEIIFLRGGYSENQIKILRNSDSKGIVVAGFGAGTIPNDLVKIISEKAEKGCIFIISSRVSRVSVLPETMNNVYKNNVLPSGTLNPQKSAILLSLGLKENLKAFEFVKFLKLLEIQ